MFSLRFADSAAFQLLWLLPLVLIMVGWTRKRTQALLDQNVSSRFRPFLLRTVSHSRRRMKIWLQVAALFFFIFALARPQSGEGRTKASSEGLEIMLAVDVSNSMLAEDARPSRLELAKKELTRFVEMMGGDRVGLVAFAGSAILLSPLTNDKGAIKMFIEGLTPEAVATQGTDFRKALNEAYNALNRGGLDSDEQKTITRVIVVASDGEENEKGGLEAAKRIAGEGAKIFTLGFGTEQGGQIPVRDERGNLIGYKRDRSNQVVVTKSTGKALQELAEAGGGTYQHVTFGSDAISNLRANVDQLQKAQMETMEVTNYTEHYQSFLAFGLLLALIELLLGERKREGRLWRGRFEVPLD